MSAVPVHFMRHDLHRPHERKGPARDRGDAETAVQKFWQWFAIAALLFCWIAEATMCAERGF